MSYRKKSNKLITVECEATPGGKRQVFLMGLVSMQRKRGGTEGWVLLISGDPLIPSPTGKPFPNRISQDKIYLTDFQKMTLSRSTFIHDGFVYMYTGNFFIANSRKSGGILEPSLDVLVLLGDHMSKHTLEFDTERVVPFKFGQLREIITPRQIKPITDTPCFPIAEPQVPESDGVPGTIGHLKFRKTANEFFVDLECPAIHSGYCVEVSLLQTVECKSKAVKSCVRREIITILEEDSIYIRPSFMGKSYPVTVTVKAFKLPTGGIEQEQKKLQSFEVRSIKYWVKACLVKNKVRTEIMMRELYLMARNQKHGGSRPTRPRARKYFVRRSSTNWDSSSSQSSSSDEYSLGDAHPIALVIMEIELDAFEETEEE